MTVRYSTKSTKSKRKIRKKTVNGSYSRKPGEDRLRDHGLGIGGVVAEQPELIRRQPQRR